MCLGQFWHSVFYWGSSDAFFLYFWADLLIIRFSLLRPPTSVGLLTYFELFGSILIDAILYIFGYVDEDWTFKVYIYFYFSLINLLALNSILLKFFSFSEICFIFLLPSSTPFTFFCNSAFYLTKAKFFSVKLWSFCSTVDKPCYFLS